MLAPVGGQFKDVGNTRPASDGFAFNADNVLGDAAHISATLHQLPVPARHKQEHAVSRALFDRGSEPSSQGRTSGAVQIKPDSVRGCCYVVLVQHLDHFTRVRPGDHFAASVFADAPGGVPGTDASDGADNRWTAITVSVGADSTVVDGADFERFWHSVVSVVVGLLPR